MKEINFKRCFVNGKKSGVASYDNNAIRLLYFSQSLGAGVGVEDLRNEGVSLHQFNNSIALEAATAEAIHAVIPGAVIEWEGSKEYNERVAAAVGSRGGSSNGGSSSAVAVATSDAFKVPALAECPMLFDMVKNMSPVVDSLNVWAAECSTALLSGSECVTAPDCVDQLANFLPGIVDAFKAYQTVIVNAVNDYREKMAAIEAEKKAKEEEAKKAAEAAANGKQLVSLEDGSTVEVSGKVHAAFVETCTNVKNGIHTYIYGPAGTGKTYLAKQVADALGVPFYMTQKIANDFQLTGFVDAAGKYQGTALYQAVKNGGVLLVDELDASDECAAVVLNTVAANGYMDFPGVGRVECHPDFHIIATGNTIGRGADSDYTGRNCLDAATLDRFGVVSVGYDPEIELKIAGGDKDLIDFIHAVRAAVKSCGVSLLVSMRSIENITKVKNFRDPVRCLSGLLFKGLEKDQISLIANECKGNNKWFETLRTLAA